MEDTQLIIQEANGILQADCSKSRSITSLASSIGCTWHSYVSVC